LAGVPGRVPCLDGLRWPRLYLQGWNGLTETWPQVSLSLFLFVPGRPQGYDGIQYGDDLSLEYDTVVLFFFAAEADFKVLPVVKTKKCLV
jgi:hypothetical protein